MLLRNVEHPSKVEEAIQGMEVMVIVETMATKLTREEVGVGISIEIDV